MSTPNLAEYGATLLRVSMGVLFLSHVGLRLFYYKLDYAVSFFESIGLSSLVFYLVTSLEIIGGLALILGVTTRIVSLIMLPIIVGTIVMVHGSNGFLFSNPGGGWEYPAFWTIALLVQAMIGPGKLSLVLPNHLVLGCKH